MLIKYPEFINGYTKKYPKPQILFINSIPEVQEAGPLWSFYFPFVAYFSILIIKVNIFIISSNMSLHICNDMGYNQHAHTHFSGIIISELVILPK